MSDITQKINPVTAIAPVSVSDNTVQNSAIIDTRGYNSLVFVVNCGSIADADATFAVTMLHGNSSDLSDSAAVTQVDLSGTLANAGFKFDDDNKTKKIGYVGKKRYVRLVVTPSNNASSAVFGAVAVLGSPNMIPTPEIPA